MKIKPADRLVVIGAGIAGLAAAAALAPFFKEVRLLERDELPKRSAARKSVPQSYQVHGLLSGGFRAMAKLFPDVERDLEALGAVRVDFSADYRLEVSEQPWMQDRSHLIGYSMSRPLVEHALRQRVLAIPNLVFEHRRVMGLACDRQSSRVLGVDVGIGGSSGRIPADFVIDASGRPNLGQELMKSLGFAEVPKSVVDFQLSYATGNFANASIPEAFKAVMTYPINQGERRSGILAPMEEGLHKATLVCSGDLDAPTNEAEFRHQLNELRTSTIAEALTNAELVGEIERFNFPSSTWLHWEKAPRKPRRYLPVGDAHCRFNPVYGQGMSIAAIEAIVLQELVHTTDLENLFDSYLHQISPTIGEIWKSAVITQGREFLSDENRAAAQYQHHLFQLASVNQVIATTLLEVIHLTRPGSALATAQIQELVNLQMKTAEKRRSAAQPTPPEARESDRFD
ncbi:hypothetical protein DUT91_16750 [Phyllobacterium salinisoli]|uniref:FAD-binding domain-containing protein n=1 Tax=Phyllobacterium salinisoli TaxID=1899321 RepID=A0A368K245_9HYPH|nr:FAD-dependent monooxygenase [Phyllobacterium salinisoli]RCS22553.1 hypothetical protein DUT91_16750 [Phyllobacterium salinisoli]